MFGNPTDKNNDKQNNNPTPSPFGNTTGTTENKPSGGLFGSTSGGLFGNVSGGGLFSGAGNSQLKTSQRKQGGLFGSVTGKGESQAPKLSFGGLSATTPTPGGLFGSSMGAKKQQPSKTGPLFQQSTGFPTITPGGGLFSSNTQQNQKQPQQSKQKTSQGGLFSTVTTEQSKGDKPESGLFGPTPNGLFANTTQATTPGGLFAPEKKEGGLFGSSTAAESVQFSKTNHPIFLAATKKEEKKTQTPPGGLFGSTPTNFTISGQPPNKMPTQTPKFSLTNNTSFGGSGGLFGNAPPSTSEQKPSSTTNITPQQQPKPLSQPQSSFFGGLVPTINKPKEETTKANVSMFGSNGGFFGAKTEAKPAETSGLFGNNQQNVQTTLTPTPVGGSLFNQNNNQQPAKKQTKPAEGSLFSNKTEPAKSDKQITVPTFGSNQNIELKQSAKVPETLLTSFSRPQKQVQNDQKSQQITSKQEQVQNQESRKQTRTISFNQKQGRTQPLSAAQPAYNEFRTVLQQRKKPQTENQLQQTQINSTQNLTRTTSTTEVPQVSTNLPFVSTPVQGQKPSQQQSFFKPSTELHPKPSVPIQKVLTAHQISTALQSGTQAQQREQSRKLLKSIQQWISTSFQRSNQIHTSEMKQQSFTLHENEDINRFLNDLIRQVVEIVNLPYEEKSFILVNKLFDELLQKLDIKEFLFKCTKVDLKGTVQAGQQQRPQLQIVQLNTPYFLKHEIYKFTPQSISLNLDSSQIQRYILAMVKKFIANQLEYLEFLQSKIELLQLPHMLFYQLAKYSLRFNRSRVGLIRNYQERLPEMISLVQDFERRIVGKITTLLSTFVNQNFYSFLLVNKQLLPEIVKLLDNFSYTEEDELITLTLKVILNGLDLSSTNTQSLNPQLKAVIKETKSLQLLPFRTLLSCLQPNQHYTLSPSAHDLYRYIMGPEWLDWLELYLTSGTTQTTEKELSIIEARYIIKILAYPSLGTKRINRAKITPKQTKYLENLQKKILSRKRPIYKFIASLKDENMLDIFYLILTSLIYDYESYRRISETFFRQKDEFTYEFRTVVAEVCNYPVQQFREEIPFLEEKIMYFLRVCEVAPERALQLQRLVFDGTVSRSLESEISDSLLGQSCHRLCHLVIDAITYFSLKQSQPIIAKCISTIKSLLDYEPTSQPMNLAMSINKPQLTFITNAVSTNGQLSSQLIKEMLQLLEYFLISPEWTTMLCTKLKTNNDESAGLERYYALRYSVKDYATVVREITQCQSNSIDILSTTPLTLTHSSYWLLRCLETMVQAFRQQQGTSMKKTLLYNLNLIVEKLFIPMSVRFNGEINSAQSFEASQRNSPIYATGESSQIPKVLLYLVESLNSIDLLGLLEQNLKYTLVKSGQVIDQQTLVRQPIYQLKNTLLQNSYEQNQFAVYLTVRLMKKLLLVYRCYEEYKNSTVTTQSLNGEMLKGESHFVFKLLTRLKWINEVEYGVFLNAGTNAVATGPITQNKRVNLIVAIVTLLLQDQQQSSTPTQIETPPVNLKQQNYERPFIVPIDSLNTSLNLKKPQLSTLGVVERFYSLHGEKLNFESVNNVLVISEDRYLESYQSLQTLCVDALGLMISGAGVIGCGYRVRVQQSINLVKALGFYSDSVGPTIPSTWVIEHLESQLVGLVLSGQSSIQLKESILNLLYQTIRTGTSASFIISKKIFYSFLPRYLNLRHSFEQMNRMNLIVVKTVNLLEQKDPFIVKQLYNDSFMDSLIQTILKQCSTIVKSSAGVLKLMKSFGSKQHYPLELAYYHLQRTCEERDLVDSGNVYNILREVIELIQRRFFSGVNDGQTHKWKSIRKLNSILINQGLVWLAGNVLDSGVTTMSGINLSTDDYARLGLDTRLPRCFITNPLEHHITHNTISTQTNSAFNIYKQNIIDWVSYASVQLGYKSVQFITWTLTIDKTLYGNQPISPKSRQLSKQTSESITCSSHMGDYRHTAVELFAETQQEAVNLVKELFDLSFRNLQNGMSVSQQKCFSILGYCLEWIRARIGTSGVLSHLVKTVIKHSFWVDGFSLKNRYVIKFLLSLVSLGKELLEEQEYVKIRVPVMEMIRKFMRNRTLVEESVVQQLVSVLIGVTPEDEVDVGEIISMWKGETNNEYFYNQSRLVLEMAQRCPLQVAKLKPLTTCEKINKLSNLTQYNYNLRHPDAVTFIWALKIATVLISTEQQSLIIFQQIRQFFTLHSQLIYNLLLNPPTTISLVYVQQLHALLEFLSTLVVSQSWLTVLRNDFQKIVFLLSHKLINFVLDYVAGKLKTVVVSDIEKRFRKVRFETLTDLDGMVVASMDLDVNSVFKLIIQIKMAQLISTFVSLLAHSFYQSHYIHLYFNQEVYQNYRYGVSFWDRINKSVCDLAKYSLGILKKYKKTENLSQKLLLIQDCSNSAEFFVETGYLSSLYGFPTSTQQMFTQINDLIANVLSLGNVHLIQSRTFRQKYQCLMKGNIQKFGKKLMENVKILQGLTGEEYDYRDNRYYETVHKNLENVVRSI